MDFTLGLSLAVKIVALILLSTNSTTTVSGKNLNLLGRDNYISIVFPILPNLISDFSIITACGLLVVIVRSLI